MEGYPSSAKSFSHSSFSEVGELYRGCAGNHSSRAHTAGQVALAPPPT
jgi:hypothetical protein